MSYPRSIQTLIIEDEQEPKQYYEHIIDAKRDKHQLAPPHFAFCYDDALRHLREDRIYHLVTIDLRLSESHGLPPAESVDFGVALLQECRERNTYPIPAVLVISVHLDRAQQDELEEAVRSSFAYGRVLVKSDHLEKEFARAFEFIDTYTGVGIHVRDGGCRVFPTLTPREDDLLRRAVLANSGVGLDVEWWSSELDRNGDWTKTLLGRFILADGQGHSRFAFFKLSADAGAQTTFQDVELMAHKLSHVKVLWKCIGGDRSLLLTQSANTGTSAPISLGTMLSEPFADVEPSIHQVADDIVRQVALLGDITPDNREVCKLLWQHHDLARIEEQWNQRGGPDILKVWDSSVSSPVELFRDLQSDRTPQRYEHQTVLHGDLNVTNVALERAIGGFHAFIFDASGTQGGVCVRDIAMLEVTTLLHQDEEEGLTAACADLYCNDFESCALSAAGNDRIRNTISFVQALRQRAFKIV